MSKDFPGWIINVFLIDILHQQKILKVRNGVRINIKSRTGLRGPSLRPRRCAARTASANLGPPSLL